MSFVDRKDDCPIPSVNISEYSTNTITNTSCYRRESTCTTLKRVSIWFSTMLNFDLSGDPYAPLMVMVHGFPEFWYSWRFQIEHFKDRYRYLRCCSWERSAEFIASTHFHLQSSAKMVNHVNILQQEQILSRILIKTRSLESRYTQITIALLRSQGSINWMGASAHLRTTHFLQL